MSFGVTGTQVVCVVSCLALLPMLGSGVRFWFVDTAGLVPSRRPEVAGQASACSR